MGNVFWGDTVANVSVWDSEISGVVKLFLFESKVNVYKDIDGIVDYNREIAENI